MVAVIPVVAAGDESEGVCGDATPILVPLVSELARLVVEVFDLPIGVGFGNSRSRSWQNDRKVAEEEGGILFSYMLLCRRVYTTVSSNENCSAYVRAVIYRRRIRDRGAWC